MVLLEEIVKHRSNYHNKGKDLYLEVHMYDLLIN